MEPVLKESDALDILQENIDTRIDRIRDIENEGLEAYTVDHNWDEELQEVTEYDIRFRDGTVKRNVSINELEVLEAFSEANHGNRDEHPGAKKAKKKDEEDEEKSVNEDMGKAEEELKAKIKQAEDDGDKKKAEELRKQLQQMGGTMEEAAKPDFIDLDGDGDKEESMKKAAADKKAGKKGEEDDEKEKQEESFRAQVRKQIEEILKIN